MKLAISSHFLTKQKHQIETHVLNLERQLPNEEEMDALLTEINLAGMRRQLRFELFRPGTGHGQGVLRRAAHRNQNQRHVTPIWRRSWRIWPTFRVSSP